MLKNPLLQKLHGFWLRIPFRHVLLLTIFLSFWDKEKLGEKYPFTNFPMYSHLDRESDVLYVTNQSGEVLPFHTLFGTKTAAQKKIFIDELEKILEDKNRDTRDALLEERQQAAKKLLTKLMPRLKADRLPPGTQSLQFHYKVFKADGDHIVETEPQLIAEQAVSPTAS